MPSASRVGVHPSTPLKGAGIEEIQTASEARSEEAGCQARDHRQGATQAQVVPLPLPQGMAGGPFRRPPAPASAEKPGGAEDRQQEQHRADDLRLPGLPGRHVCPGAGANDPVSHVTCHVDGLFHFLCTLSSRPCRGNVKDRDPSPSDPPTGPAPAPFRPDP